MWLKEGGTAETVNGGDYLAECRRFPLTLTLSPKGRGKLNTLSPLGRGLGKG